MVADLNKQEVIDLFVSGIDCGQAVASYYADRFGLSEEELNRVTAAFGGGFGIGETCGAVNGAMVVLGLKYGHGSPEEADRKALMNEKIREFLAEWQKRRGSCACRDKLGHDISQPGEFEKVLEEGTMLDLCPELVLDSIDILESIIADDEKQQ